VKFVENHQPHPFQRRVVLQAPGEDALGHHLDARLRPYPAFQANAITHGLPDLLAQLAGQPLGRRPRGQASGFEHEDGLPGQPGLAQQGQRHAGGLAGAGRGFEHGFVTVSQGVAQGGEDGVDG
jgi:hypothetical protein